MKCPSLKRYTSAGQLAWMAYGLLNLASTATVAAPLQCAPVCPSQTLVEPSVSESVKSLTFRNTLASRAGDPRLFVLLGSDFIRAISYGDTGAFVSNWVSAHPRATYTPISTIKSTNTRTHKKMEITYIWVSEGAASLNIDMVRQGIFAGATMYDMVDNARGLDRLLQSDPKLADAKAQIEKERAAAPEDRAERLISERDYHLRLQQVLKAESSARKEKLGIWSDQMKAEREAEGLS